MWPRNEWTSRKRPHPRQTSRPELDMRSHLSTSFDGNGYFVCCFPAKVLNVGAAQPTTKFTDCSLIEVGCNRTKCRRVARRDLIPSQLLVWLENALSDHRQASCACLVFLPKANYVRIIELKDVRRERALRRTSKRHDLVQRGQYGTIWNG